MSLIDCRKASLRRIAAWHAAVAAMLLLLLLLWWVGHSSVGEVRQICGTFLLRFCVLIPRCRYDDG
jgi:hypothetical protein